MKSKTILLGLASVISFGFYSCEKNQPAYKLEGNYYGNFQGVYMGNDTIVNSGYNVLIQALDKNSATVNGTLFSTFEVLVTPNGLNIELVADVDGLSNFLYQGETKKLTFTYAKDDNTATFIGYKQE